MSMSGRYTLTVTYSERNPNYMPPQRNYGYEDPRSSEQQNEYTHTVLSCELTPEQWAQLKSDTLSAWNPTQEGK